MDDIQDLVLTTVDNPYNPHTQYEQWRRWDIENEYYTESFLARMLDLPLDMDLDDELSINILTIRAIQDIIDNDDANIYKLVSAEG